MALPTRTYIPYVETPFSVIILRLINFLRHARNPARPPLDRENKTRTIYGRTALERERESLIGKKNGWGKKNEAG